MCGAGRQAPVFRLKIHRRGNTLNKHLSPHLPDVTIVYICSLTLASNKVQVLACFKSLSPLSLGNHYCEYGLYFTSQVWGCLTPTFRTGSYVRV